MEAVEENTKSPSDKDETIIHTKVFRSKEIRGKRRHKCKTTTILPISNTYRQKQ
jgi:hypothetical protein